MRVQAFAAPAVLLGTILVIGSTTSALASTGVAHAKKTEHSAVHAVVHETASKSSRPSVKHEATVHHIVAETSSRHGASVHSASVRTMTTHSSVSRLHGHIIHAVARSSYSGSYISCVPFARAATGIDLKGNAANWWDAAAGVYARGSRPELGSVMNFRATGRMRLGHVAVVSSVINAREVEIDQANWTNRGGISRGVPVIDVSANNDWSAVRVGIGGGNFGSVYPTYGFIYTRPDNGHMEANNAGQASQAADVEVAEAPADFRGIDAANHSLR